MAARLSKHERLTGKPRLFMAWMPEGVDALLDVGCAFSFMLDLLGRKARRRFGVEYDVEKLREARQRFPDIHYACGSGEALPMADATMDVVTFFEVLEHVENERRFLEEVHRVLKPGGLIMLSVPNKGDVEWMDIDNLVFTPALALVKKLGFCRNVSDYYLRPHHHYSLEDLRRLFGSLFTIEKVYYGGLAANQIGFLLYKSAYLALQTLGLSHQNGLLKTLERWMDRITSWDFDHSYGPRSDKLCALARKTPLT
jgi:ubiquinone/menaquinone biosynthesis C-methylase UbiE